MKRRWLDLTAEYTTEEDAAMVELRSAGFLHELEVIHLLKSLCDARIIARD
jgi:hypothetical protein